MARKENHTSEVSCGAISVTRGQYPSNIRTHRQLVSWAKKQAKIESETAAQDALFVALMHVPSTRPDFRDPSVIRWFDQCPKDGMVCDA